MDNNKNIDDELFTKSDENLDKQSLTTGELNAVGESLNNPILTINQDINMHRVNNLKSALKSKKMWISCPYCNNQDFTKT